MEVLLPLDDDSVVLKQNNLGFQPLADAYNLKEIAARMTAVTGIEDNTNAVIVNAGETAIPDVCAHTQYLRTKLEEQVLDVQDEAVRAWIGVMAIIALSEKKMFHLTVKRLNLNGNAPLKSVYREALRKEKLLDDEENLHVLMLGGNPIAVIDPYHNRIDAQQRCFCYPFSTIDDPASVMYPVKWFQPGSEDPTSHKRTAHRWYNVMGIDPVTTLPFLDEQDRILFVQWLDALKKTDGIPFSSSTDYPEAVDSVIRLLKSGITDGATLISVETTVENDPEKRPENLAAWQGVLACVALSKLRGSQLALEVYRPRYAEDPLRTVMLRHAGKKSFMQVLVNGARVGILDDKLLIRPNYCVTDVLLTNDIPWFRNGHWIEISSEKIPDKEMGSQEKRRLAYWFDQVAQQAGLKPKISLALTNSADNLKKSFGAAIGGKSSVVTEFTPGAIMSDGNPIPAEFSTVLTSIPPVPDLANPMPAAREIFTERLVLTMVGSTKSLSELGIMPDKKLGRSIDNILVLNDDDPFQPKSERFLALLPLRSDFTKKFSETPEGINLISFNLTNQGDEITAHIILNNGGVTVVNQWVYSISRGEVIFCEKCPYVAMWPYVRSDSWKEYYVVLCDRLRSKNSSGILRSVDPDEDQYPLLPVEKADTVTTYDKDMDHRWEMLTYHKFPEYVHFKINDGGVDVEVGGIYVAYPKIAHTTSGSTYYAAIDFGTSNTIVRLMNSAGKIVMEGPQQPYRVFTNKYVQPLTRCADEVEDFYDRVRSFHDFYWLPFQGQAANGPLFWVRDNEKATDRLPTVVELYNDASVTNNKAPRYGQLLRSDCNVMAYFLGEQQKKSSVSKENRGIQSHIKMKKIGASTPLYDGQIAVQMILLECALAAIEHDANLSFIVSYPDDRMWEGLKKYWIPAANNAQSICSSINFIGNVELKTTELFAAHSYASKFVMGVNPQTGYCIIDIGGGTTDISLWKSPVNKLGNEEVFQGGLSLKYAGDQITAETVFSFYRKLCGTADADFDSFRMLWDLNGAIAIEDYEKKMEQGFRDLVDMNFDIGTNIIKLHEEVPHLSTTIISECSFSQAVQLGFANVQPFTALMRTKVASVFYVVAQFLKFVGAYDMEHPRTSYKFCLAGNGAAALDACGSDMDNFLVGMIRTIVADRNFEIQNFPTFRKTEVVNGMCALVQSKLAVGPLRGASVQAPEGIQQKVFKDIEIENLPGFMWDAYCQYVENFLNPNSSCFPGTEGFLSVDGDVSIYDMLTLNDEENQTLFYNNYNAILNQVINESGSGTPNYIVAQIAAIKLVDRILLIDKYR